MTKPMNLAGLPDGLMEVTTWQDRLLQWLERVYASPKLYQWSLTNPLTRWITKRRTQQIFDLMSGFVYSQVLLGCVRLDLFKMLYQNPLDLQQIARQTKLSEQALQRLLLSAVSLGLLERRSHQKFGLGALGVPLAMHPGIGAMVFWQCEHCVFAECTSSQMSAFPFFSLALVSIGPKCSHTPAPLYP
jgi:demethylspheroidene O-methyltransferase